MHVICHEEEDTYTLAKEDSKVVDRSGVRSVGLNGVLQQFKRLHLALLHSVTSEVPRGKLVQRVRIPFPDIRHRNKQTAAIKKEKKLVPRVRIPFPDIRHQSYFLSFVFSSSFF